MARGLNPEAPTNAADGARQNLVRALWRAMSLGGENLGDCLVVFPGLRKLDQTSLHFLEMREGAQIIDGYGDTELASCAAAPNDAHKNLVGGCSAQNNFVDQAAQ